MKPPVFHLLFHFQLKAQKSKVDNTRLICFLFFYVYEHNFPQSYVSHVEGFMFNLNFSIQIHPIKFREIIVMMKTLAQIFASVSCS